MLQCIYDTLYYNVCTNKNPTNFNQRKENHYAIQQRTCKRQYISFNFEHPQKEDLYGYKIIRELEIASEKAFEMTEGTLYPILHALEKEEMLESYWQEKDGRNRKYYHITKKGLKALAEKQNEWESFSSSVNRVLNYA